MLEPHHLKVGNIPATPAPLEQVTERFAELCADAAEHHGAKIAYEIMPFDPNVRTLDDVIAVARAPARRTAASRSTPGTWASSASRPTSCAASRSSTSPGSS